MVNFYKRRLGFWISIKPADWEPVVFFNFRRFGVADRLSTFYLAPVRCRFEMFEAHVGLNFGKQSKICRSYLISFICHIWNLAIRIGRNLAINFNTI